MRGQCSYMWLYPLWHQSIFSSSSSENYPLPPATLSPGHMAVRTGRQKWLKVTFIFATVPLVVAHFTNQQQVSLESAKRDSVSLRSKLNSINTGMPVRLLATAPVLSPPSYIPTNPKELRLLPMAFSSWGWGEEERSPARNLVSRCPGNGRLAWKRARWAWQSCQ